MVLPRSVKGTEQVSLIACPPEIISQTAGYLDTSSLNKLALSSRFLNLIFTPHLYDHIQILGYRQDWSRSQSIKLRNLTLLLLERPHLAGYVRHFSMHNDFRREAWDEHTEIAHLPQAFLTAIEAASHSKEEERQWLKDVSSTHLINGDALMALLLPTLRNLKTLDLRLGDDIMYFSRMLQRASGKEKPFDTTPAFEKVSDIMFVQNKRVWTCYDEDHYFDDHDDDDDDDDGCEYLSYTVPLPAVTRVFGLKFGFNRGISKQEPWLLSLACGVTFQLTHLELRDCLLNSQALADILRVPFALKTFIYEVSVLTPESSAFNLNIHRAMEHQMSSLKNVWLDCIPWNADLSRFRQWVDWHSVAQPIPSFANFNNLRTLRIASPFLFGSIHQRQREGAADLLAPILPNGITTLHITRCDDGIAFICKELEFLLGHLTYTPHLSKIIIEDPWGEVLEPSSYVRDLANYAEGMSISFSAVKGGPEHHADDQYDWKGLGIDGSLPWAATARGDFRSYADKISDVQSKFETLPPLLQRPGGDRDVSLLPWHGP